MSPFASVGMNGIVSGHIPENGEINEDSRAAWTNTIFSVAANSLSRRIGHTSTFYEDDVRLLIRALGMPELLAIKLLDADLQREIGFTIFADTVFENGSREMGGPRHYNNFRIK